MTANRGVCGASAAGAVFARADGHRREHREDLVVEDLLDRAGLAVVQLRGPQSFDPRLGQLGLEEVHEAGVLVFHQLAHAFADSGQLLGGGHAGGVGAGHAFIEQDVQTADADHEEFVQVGAGDGQELQSLQRRQRLVAGLVENALVELQPGELAVEEFWRRGGLVGHGEGVRDQGSGVSSQEINSDTPFTTRGQPSARDAQQHRHAVRFFE
jgi:hypothetical protein